MLFRSLWFCFLEWFERKEIIVIIIEKSGKNTRRQKKSVKWTILLFAYAIVSRGPVRLIQIHSKDIALVSITISRIQTTVIPHYIIILSLTCVPPAASCYKGVCHFMCSHSGLVLLLPSLPRCRCHRQRQEGEIVIHQKAERIKGMVCRYSVLFFDCILYGSHLGRAQYVWRVEFCWLLIHILLHMNFFFVLIFWFGCWLPARSMVWLWYLDGWFVGWVCCFFRCISLAFFG